MGGEVLMADTTPDTHEPALDHHSVRHAAAQLGALVRHRVQGLGAGDVAGILPSPGTDLAEAREYVPGDDVRYMDWAVTARTRVPHVRDTIGDRELESYLIIDCRAGMTAGSTATTKLSHAATAAAVVLSAATHGANRTGAVFVHDDHIDTLPAASGKDQARLILERVIRAERRLSGRGEEVTANPRPGVREWFGFAARAQRNETTRSPQQTTSAAATKVADAATEPTPDLLAVAADRVVRLGTKRGLVVIISDFLGPLDWASPLRVLAARGEVFAIRIVDPLDEALPVPGTIMLRPAYGGKPQSFSITPRVRAEYAAAAAAHTTEVGQTIRRAGARATRLSTEGDAVLDLIAYGRRRRASAGVL